MSARIRSKLNGLSPIDEASRNDLVSGDIVSVEALDAATTYFWQLVDVPEGSAATFSGNPALVTPGSFTCDLEGPYLVRLTVDATLVTESTQYVRLRRLTDFGQLTLVSAGERRDTTGTIPVDVSTEGWAHEQNDNLQTLLAFIKPLVSSGRLLYVDANDGTTNYADWPTVQEGIDAAVAAGASDAEQWVVVVRPGRYVENVTFAPFVHVIGWPGNPDGRSSEAVVIEGLHTAAIATGRTLVGNLHLENSSNTVTATLTKTGAATLRLFATRIESLGTHAGQGAPLALAAGILDVVRCTLSHTLSGTATRVAYEQSGVSTTAEFNDCRFLGPNGAWLNSGSILGVDATFTNCKFNATWAAVVTLAANTTLDHCTLTSANGLYVNPLAVSFAGPVTLTMLFCSVVGGDITFDTTNLSGTTTLNLGSLVGPTVGLVFPGGAVDFQVAQSVSKTHWYDNSVSGLIAENVQDAIDEVAFGAALAPVVYHLNIPEVPNDTVRYKGWSPISAELLGVRVYMETPNTVGNYELRVTNNATGNTVLLTNPTSLNGIIAATVTPITLTGTPSDLLFAALDRWTVELTSDDLGFDGEAIYVEMLFNPSTAGGPVVEDLATTLLVNNITGGRNIEFTAGDIAQFGDSPGAAVSPATTGRIRYNQATLSMQASVNGGPWGDIGATVAPQVFVYRPGGVATGNIYTNFALLYADLTAAPGLKELVFDDSISTPITIPAGVYAFSATKWSSGGIYSANIVGGDRRFTIVQFTAGTTITGLSEIEGLALINDLPATSPIQFNSGTSEALYLYHTLLFSQFGAIAPLVQISGGTTLTIWADTRSKVGGANAVAVEMLGADTLEFNLTGDSSVPDDCLAGPLASTISNIAIDSTSSFHPSQASFLGSGGVPTPELMSLASRVEVDPSGLTHVTSAEVQGAIADLDGAIPTVIPDFTGVGVSPAINTITLPADSANTLDILVSAEDPTGNNSASWFIRALAEDQGGIRAIVGSSGTGLPAFATAGAVGWTTAISMSGANVRISGNVATATTLWTVKVTAAVAA